MTLEDVRMYFIEQMPNTRQDRIIINRTMKALEDDFGSDAEFDVFDTECAFCEFEGESVAPLDKVCFPIICPNCGEQQLYIQGEFDWYGEC